jgi:hypothetical protein
VGRTHCVAFRRPAHSLTGAEDPEDVVEEEAAEEDGPGDVFAQRHVLDGLDAERHAEQVVAPPVPRVEVPVYTRVLSA